MSATRRLVWLGSAAGAAVLVAAWLWNAGGGSVAPGGEGGPPDPAPSTVAPERPPPIEPSSEPAPLAAAAQPSAPGPASGSDRHPSAASPPRTGEGLLLAGRVLDENGEPALARLEVKPSARGRLRKPSTDDAGGFEVHGARGLGPFQVIARLGARIAEQCDVEEGTLDLELRLHEAATLRGVVVDDQGRPVPSFEVAIDRVRPGAPFSLGTAGSDGAFELAGLLDGDWRVRVGAPGLAQAEPCIVTLPAAMPVVVALVSLPVVEGTVVESRGFPVPEARILSSVFLFDLQEVGVADANGAFRVPVPIGPVKLLASHPWLGTSQSAPLELGPGEVVGGVTLVLDLPAVLRGVVVDAEGRPLAGTGVRLTRTSGDLARHVLTDAEGRFVLDGLFAGEAELEIRHERLRLLREVRLEPGETTELSFRVEVGPPVTLEGRVLFGGEAIAEGRLQVARRLAEITDRLELDPVRFRAGSYDVDLPGAGTYDLVVQASGLEFSRVVEVSAAGTVEDLVLERSGIVGRLVDASGQGVADAWIQSEWVPQGASGLRAFRSWAWTDARGGFRLDVVPGRHDLSAGLEEGWTWTRPPPLRTVLVPPGETCAGVELVVE